MDACADTSIFTGEPIRCHLPAGHEGEWHFDRHLHRKWKLGKTRKGHWVITDTEWADPFTPLERWFSNLPNMGMERNCHCGSDLPVVYWSREEGTACRACRSSFHLYIPSAVIWNIMDKFSFPLPLDEIGKLLEAVADPEEKK